MKLLLFALAVLCVMSTGCATVPTPIASAQPGKSLSPIFGTATPGTGRIVVKRDTGFTGGGCTHRIHLDGAPAAALSAGQAIALYAQPGEHVLSAVATGICDGTSEAIVMVEAGKTKSMRSGYDGNGNIRLQPTAF
jgi:hypothetical protein